MTCKFVFLLPYQEAGVVQQADVASTPLSWLLSSRPPSIWLLCLDLMLLYWLDLKAFWTVGNPAYGPMTDSQQHVLCLCSLDRRPWTLVWWNQTYKGWRKRYFAAGTIPSHPSLPNHSDLHGAPDTETHVTWFSLHQLLAVWYQGSEVTFLFWPDFSQAETLGGDGGVWCCTQPGHSFILPAPSSVLVPSCC